MKRKTQNDNLKKLFIIATAILWIGVIFWADFILRSGGHLKPKAAGLGEVVEAYGAVVDKAGSGIGGAKVTLTNDGKNNYIITDSQGQFAIINLKYGNYDLNVDKVGYEPIDTKIVIDGAGKNYQFTMTD